jgi:transcription initiation factor TFIID subunit 5
MLNTFFNINLYSSDNQIESEKPEELNSSSQLLTYNESEISQNSKIFESNSDKELLLSAIKKVRNSEPCVPSICLYSIQSSSLSCISVTNDMKLVAGGFEDSKICLWSFASNDYNKCHSIMNVKRKSSQIELNIIDHDLKDDENSDQVSDNELDLNSSTTGQSVKVLRGHSGPVYGLTFVPETNILLSCSCDTTVRAWDTVSSNNIAVYESHLSPIWSIDSCILGNYFATGCKDGVAYLWSIERSFPLRLYCGHNMDVDCVKFHPNCTFIATGSGDKLIKMWDIQQARVVRSFNGHQASIYSLSFSPSGKYLASAGEDRKVKLWDIASGKLIKDFNGHTDTVHSLSFNYNETILASCGSDQTLKLWNLQNITDSSNPTLIFKSEISENT